MQFRLGFVTCLFLSSVCFADASDYNYVQAAYVSADNDIVSGVDFDGFAIEGSYQFYQDFYGTVRYVDVSDDGDVAGLSASADQLNVGIGYIFGSNTTASFYGEFNYIDVSASASSGGISASASDDGYGFGAGFRLNTSSRSELHLGVLHEEVGSLDAETTLVGEFVFDFFPSANDGIAVSGLFGYNNASAGDLVYFGARVTF